MFSLILKFSIFFVCLVSEAKLDTPPRCPRSLTNDKLLADEEKCYSFQESRTGALSFDQAALLCSQLGNGKRLASVANQKESAFVAAEMKRLGWTKVAMSGRYQRSAWKWTADDTFLRGQGCYRITGDSSEVTFQAADMNIAKCTESCMQDDSAGKLFASLQGGRFCHCSSDEFAWPPPASDCLLLCSGAKNESCGGLFSRYTYATAEDVFDNWAIGRPSMGGDCAAIAIDHNANSWIDTSCNLALPFICKFGNGEEISNSGSNSKIPISAERIACSMNACYHLYTNPQMTWLDADKFCAKYGGRLAKIESADQQELINTMLYDLNQQQAQAGPMTNNNKIQEQIDEQTAPAAVLQAWIGASNHAWYDFADSNATLTGAYQSWLLASQPEMPEANACTVFSVSPNGDGWLTANCNSAIDGGRFLCVSSALVN